MYSDSKLNQWKRPQTPNSTSIRWTIPRTMTTIGHMTTMGYTVSSSHALFSFLFFPFPFPFLFIFLDRSQVGRTSQTKLQVGLASPLWSWSFNWAQFRVRRLRTTDCGLKDEGASHTESIIATAIQKKQAGKLWFLRIFGDNTMQHMQWLAGAKAWLSINLNTKWVIASLQRSAATHNHMQAICEHYCQSNASNAHNRMRVANGGLCI